jgi:hypothetical protein
VDFPSGRYGVALMVVVGVNETKVIGIGHDAGFLVCLSCGGEGQGLARVEFARR